MICCLYHSHAVAPSSSMAHPSRVYKTSQAEMSILASLRSNSRQYSMSFCKLSGLSPSISPYVSVRGLSFPVESSAIILKVPLLTTTLNDLKKNPESTRNMLLPAVFVFETPPNVNVRPSFAPSVYRL